MITNNMQLLHSNVYVYLFVIVANNYGILYSKFTNLYLQYMNE